jgi:hypothetical protein
MREGVRRWARRLLRLVFVLVVLYCAVKGADSIWFRARLPADFHDANWSGTWHTNQYGIAGRLVVRLPDPLPKSEEFKAEALVYYPIYSGWKTGRFVKMDFTGYFRPEASSSSGESTVPSPQKEKGGELKFKGTSGNQIVDYVALIHREHDLIVGGYLSQTPDDYGIFSLRHH